VRCTPYGKKEEVFEIATSAFGLLAMTPRQIAAEANPSIGLRTGIEQGMANDELRFFASLRMTILIDSSTPLRSARNDPRPTTGNSKGIRATTWGCPYVGAVRRQGENRRSWLVTCDS